MMPVMKQLKSVYLILLHPSPTHGATAPSRPVPPRCRAFTITLTHTTLGRTPLDKWSARHRELYLTTHNTHRRQTSMLLAAFEPAIPGSERPQTHALDWAPTGYGSSFIYLGSFAIHHNLLLGYEVRSMTRNSAFRNVTAYSWLGNGHPMHDWHRDFYFRYILQDRSGAQLSSRSTSNNSTFFKNKAAYYWRP